jgi:hypothetical protein
MVVKLKDVRRKALKMLDSGTKLRNFLQPPGAICVHNSWKTFNMLFSDKLPTKFKHFA